MNPWIYNLFAFIIIGWAIFVAIKRIFERFSPSNKTSACEKGCSSCTSKCELKSLVDTRKANQ